MDQIVTALAKTIIAQSLTGFPLDEKARAQAGAVLYQKIIRMPWLIKIPLYVITFVVDSLGIVLAGRRFSILPEEQRQEMLVTVDRWGWLSPFLKFYRKMSLYIYYSLQEPLP